MKNNRYDELQYDYNYGKLTFERFKALVNGDQLVELVDQSIDIANGRSNYLPTDLHIQALLSVLTDLGGLA